MFQPFLFGELYIFIPFIIICVFYCIKHLFPMVFGPCLFSEVCVRQPEMSKNKKWKSQKRS